VCRIPGNEERAICQKAVARRAKKNAPRCLGDNEERLTNPSSNMPARKPALPILKPDTKTGLGPQWFQHNELSYPYIPLTVSLADDFTFRKIFEHKIEIIFQINVDHGVFVHFSREDLLRQGVQ
jgi:hypothetical protein